MCVHRHNIAQNRPDSFPPYPPDNHHYSDDVYLREGGVPSLTNEVTHLCCIWCDHEMLTWGHFEPTGNSTGKGKECHSPFMSAGGVRLRLLNLHTDISECVTQGWCKIPDLPSHTALPLILISHPAEDRRLSWPEWLTAYRDSETVYLWMVTHPSIGWVQRTVTWLTWPIPLQRGKIATSLVDVSSY